MIAFVVSVNGKRACAVELTSENTRGVSVSWMGSPKDDESVFLGVGGMDMDHCEHVDWSVPGLKVGDEVTIKITESPTTDPPSRRRTVEEVDQWARSLRPE